MSKWSPGKAIAMEQRHILEGEKRVARQEALVGKLIENRHDQLVRTANDVLRLLRESLEHSKESLRDLEDRYGEAPTRNLDTKLGC